MSYFLVQRFSASFILSTIVAFCGFFAFGAQFSWFEGFIYLIYLYALTTFLNLLGGFRHLWTRTELTVSLQGCLLQCIDSAAL